MFCTNCGKELQDEWIRCPYCGTDVEDDEFQEENDFREESNFQEETVLASEPEGREELENKESGEGEEELENQESNEEELNPQESEDEDSENETESNIYEFQAVRRRGNYWTKEIETTVEINDDHVTVNKGKKQEKSFHLKDIKSHHFSYQPIWWISDFVRIVIFALFMTVSNGMTIFAVLLSIYMACSKHLIVVLADGTKVKIPMRQKADAAEFLEAIGCSKDEIDKCNAKKVSTRTWDIRYLILSMILFAVTFYAVRMGFYSQTYNDNMEKLGIVSDGEKENKNEKEEEYVETLETDEIIERLFAFTEFEVDNDGYKRYLFNYSYEEGHEGPEGWSLIYTKDNDFIRFQDPFIEACFADMFGLDAVYDDSGFIYDFDDKTISVQFDQGITEGLTWLEYDFNNKQCILTIEDEKYEASDEFIEALNEYSLLELMEAESAEVVLLLGENGLSQGDIRVLEFEDIEAYVKSHGYSSNSNTDRESGMEDEETDIALDEDLSIEDSVFSQKEEYILPDSSSMILVPNDLKGLSVSEMQMAINEIYARHGRRFHDVNVQAYFDCMSWYNGTIEPEQFDDSVLNKYERSNINTIVEMIDSRSGVGSEELQPIPDFAGTYYMENSDVGISLLISVYTDVLYENLQYGEAYADMEIGIRMGTGGMSWSNSSLLKNGMNEYMVSGGDLDGAILTVIPDGVVLSGVEGADGIYDLVEKYYS